ncbi:hypothetical protein Tco_0673888 [Tanacetum coccineum]
MLYPSRKIWRIRACTSPDTTKIQKPIRRIQKNPYSVSKIKCWKILEDIERGPYSKKPPIRRIGLIQYGVKMDKSDLTMDEYIELQAEKLEGMVRRLIGKPPHTVRYIVMILIFSKILRQISQLSSTRMH